MRSSHFGLPPPGPINKVSKRSKTESIKQRPISCEMSVPAKREKSFFNILRKGSSNTKLNEESECENSIERNSNSNLSKPNVNHFKGMEFDSDEDDIISDETPVTIQLKYFENEDLVISNPALLAALLDYLYTHNIDYYSLLYYLIVQLYKSISHSKDFQKEAPRYTNEIITTFLHQKAILKIDHDINIDKILENLETNNNLAGIFDNSAEEVYKHCIHVNIEKIRTSISHGLYTIEEKYKNKLFDQKLLCFNETIDAIVKRFQKKINDEKSKSLTQEEKETELLWDDILYALKSSLASIYYYFTKREKDENMETMSITSKTSRSMGIGRSTESLQIMVGCCFDKQPLFCSKIHRKNIGHSFFKKAKTLKGHHFQEKNFDFPTDCLYCNKLLWGIAPQGFYCSHCQGSVHKHCRDNVRIFCQKPDSSRKYTRNLSSSTNTFEESSKNGDKISIGDQNNDIRQNKEEIDNDNVSEHVDGKDEFNEYTEHTLMDPSQINKPGYISSTSIVILKSEDLSNQNSINESGDTFSDNTEKCGHDSLKMDKKSYVKSLTNMYDQKSITRSQSEENVDRTLKLTKRQSESVHVQDLVQDTCEWLDDPDMSVHETFEADVELKAFPNYLTKDEDRAEYTRLLVLLEFYHKIKFTVMTLKRFDYLLIQKWPVADRLLFKTLSLNCIIPLYELIKKLVATIETCKTDNTFLPDTAKKVIDWLKENDEENIQEWLRYSIDLCCTNSLRAVKTQWREMKKTDAQFTLVLNRRFNKMIVVEQLSNMRPLLFNLPLIINKVIRDLSKFSKFKDETKLWKEIHEKFKLLPSYIDERCMPLVDQINNGTIVNAMDRSVWTTRLNPSEPFLDYIIDFPKTAFHYKLFDFQDVQISNFRESGNKNKTPAVFVKDITDAYAICYDNMLVLLQKENEKYMLKQFKATDTSKINPILVLDNVHASKRSEKDKKYELTLVFISVAVLTQIIFKKETIMEKWLEFIYKSKSLKNRNSTSAYDRTIHERKSITNKTSYEAIASDKLEINKTEDLLNTFTNHESNLKEFLKELNVNDTSELYIQPNNARHCVFGSILDAVIILNKSMNLLYSETLKEGETNDLLSIIDRMKNRINNYKDLTSTMINNSNTQDTLSLNGISFDFNNNTEETKSEILLTNTKKIDDIFCQSDNSASYELRDDYADNDIPLENSDEIWNNNIGETIQSDDNSNQSNDLKDDVENYDINNFVDNLINEVIENATKQISEFSSKEDIEVDFESENYDNLKPDDEILSSIKSMP